MDELVKRAVYLDYYGGLLNEKQRSIISGKAAEDLSLSEIAEKEGISRQAVSEALKRIDQKLEGYERQLGLVSRAARIEEMLEEIRQAVEGLDEKTGARIIQITERISEEL
ncbi:MAG: DNA-binding protein [Lachnospiraceae bacterium]|nr:DNA-binding protein [Lachnospiraceae bacterium]